MKMQTVQQLSDVVPARQPNESTRVRVFFVAASLGLTTTLSLILPLHFSISSQGFVCAAIFCLVYLRHRRTIRELSGLVGLAVLFAGLRLLIGGHPKPALEPSTIALFLALASLLMLVLPIPWSPAAERKLRFSEFGLAMAVSAFTIFIQTPLQVAAQLSLITLDFNLYQFDAVFGFQPSFAVGRVLLNYPWLAQCSGVVYYGLPLVFVLLATGPSVAIRKPKLLRVMLVAGVAGACLYMIVPAAGPIYVLHDRFPFSPPPTAQFSSVATVALDPAIPRNCMPSLHLSWALLIYLNVRWSAWRRIGAVVAVVLTAVATLGFGQHYIIDLIVAIPFVMSVQRASEDHWRPVCLYALITLGWLLALRYAANLLTANPGLALALVALTFLSTIRIELNDRFQNTPSRLLP